MNKPPAHAFSRPARFSASPCTPAPECPARLIPGDGGRGGKTRVRPALRSAIRPYMSGSH
jgi:hypothetical protein